MAPTRRQLLASGASLALAGTAGCLGIFGKKPVVLRAMPATEGAAKETDAQCRLSKQFVSQYPTLQNVLRQARTNQPGTWAKTGISEKRADTIYDALVDHCGKNDVRGLYRYDGSWFYISMRYREASDHDHGEHTHTGHDHGGHTHSEHTHTHSR